MVDEVGSASLPWRAAFVRVPQAKEAREALGLALHGSEKRALECVAPENPADLGPCGETPTTKRESRSM